jgi:hypothetical protein
MRTWWRICQRYNEARYRRASKAAAAFKARAEMFFRLIKGGAR